MAKLFDTSRIFALVLVIPVMMAGLPLQGQLIPRRGNSEDTSPSRRDSGPSYPKPVSSSGYQNAVPQQRGHRPPNQKRTSAPTQQSTDAAEQEFEPLRIENETTPSAEQRRPSSTSGVKSSVKFRYQRPSASGDVSVTNRQTQSQQQPQPARSRERPLRIDFPPSTMQTSRSINADFQSPDVEPLIRRVSATEENFQRPIRRIADAVEVPEDLIEIPLNNGTSDETFQYKEQNGKITLVARQAPIAGILGLIAQQHGLNVVTSADVDSTVTVTLNDVSLDDALSAILNVNGYTWVQQKDILLISRIDIDSQLSPMVQGRQVAVFPLNFVSAVEVDMVVKGLLSPMGQSFVSVTNPTEKLKTHEQIVVEDLPEYVSRIEQCIVQMDQPPRQVLVEAHVLQVTLKNENRNGVNFENILRIANSRVSLESTGFANAASSPAFFLGVDGTDLGVLIEALQTTTDAKTLASPRVLVINGQEARIQIGAQLGYLVTTTTQTSTMQEVNFLDLGVVLKVTPQISADNRVLLTVKPEVSSGRINPDTGLPEEDTTEVQTTIMLNDGQGMIIGGLIKEGNSDVQSKIPLLGDLWMVGRLFQRRTAIRERNEIIIALVPRIVPYDPDFCLIEEDRLMQMTSPLMDKKLKPYDRPWEDQIPDAVKDPRRLKVRRLPHAARNLTEDYPHQSPYYFPSVIEEREDDERYEASFDETSRPEFIDDDAVDGPSVTGASTGDSKKFRPFFRRQ